MSLMKKLGFGVLGAAAVGVAGVAAVNRYGHRLRDRHDAVLDDPLAPPADVTHHRIPTADGGTIHVVDTGGEGRPVLLLHGVTLQWWVWSAVIRLLRLDRRVLAWDMRGHGESLAGDRGAVLEACADDLAEVLVALDLRDAVVVGHSMGGMALGQFVVRCPDVLAERVGGTVFLATSASAVSSRGVGAGLVGVARAVSDVAGAALRNPRLAYHWKDTDVSAALVSAAFGPRATSRMIDDVRRMLADMAPQRMAEALASIVGHDVTDGLSGLRAPTAIVVGTKDRLTPPVHAALLERLIPHAQLRVLPGIGHQVMQEAPEEVVAAVAAVAAVASPQSSR